MENHLKYIRFLRKKKFLNVNAELNVENSTCLISVHSFIEKPTEVLFILNVKTQVSKDALYGP